MEAEEIEMRKDEKAESFVAGILKNVDRGFFKGVDTSIEEIGIADMDIVDKDFTTLASIGQNRRRRREKAVVVEE